VSLPEPQSIVSSEPSRALIVSSPAPALMSSWSRAAGQVIGGGGAVQLV
jgi:hypothetical protein